MILNRIRGIPREIKLFLKNVWLLISFDPVDKPVFSLLCGIFSLIICNAAKAGFSRLLILARGIRYIDKGNMLSVCTSFDTILLALLFMIIMTFCALFEIGGLLHSFSMAQVGRRSDLWSMMMVGLRTCKKALHPRNWLIVVFVMVLFPLTRLITLSNIAYKVKIPSFVTLGIEARPLFAVSFRIFYLILVIAEIAVFFSINIFVLQKKTFIQSCADSWKLGRKHLLTTVICMLLLSVFTNTVINVFVRLFLHTGTTADAVRQVIRTVIVPSVNNAGITALFYQYYEEDKSLADINRYVFSTKDPSGPQKAALIAGAVLLLSGSLFYYARTYGFLAEPVEKPLVCAHRGDNVNAPDNSYESFELAASEGLPWIELDVQLTSDNVVVAEHDQSYVRRFGINKAVCEMTYEEIRQYPVIGISDSKYQDVRITTLEDVLLLAKENDMRVQIETKPSSKKPGLEEEVLRLVEETGMHDRVMIISLHSDSIERIRELDPEITTAHAVMMTWKDYADVEDADNLSAEIGTVNALLVNKLHQAGMKVFCWTADDPADIQHLVSCGVDVIGTDDPVMVNEKLEEADCSGGVKRCFHLMMQVLADMER